MEKANTRNGVIFGFVGGTFLILILSVVWLRSYFFVRVHREIHTRVLSVDNPERVALDELEEEILTTYGWVDEEKNVVRIPIDRAIELVAEEAGDHEESSDR
jgi:hypothetical protein